MSLSPEEARRVDARSHATPISEAWIGRLHEVVTEPQATYSVSTDLPAVVFLPAMTAITAVLLWFSLVKFRQRVVA